MKPLLYRPFWFVAYIVFIVAVFLFCLSVALGIPPQPGDTAAPVVDAPGPFETGLVEAYLEAPAFVEACSVLVLDVSGTSSGKRTLVFHPSVPQSAVQHDSDGDTVYVWIKKARPYAAWWAVSNASGVATAEIRFTVTPAGEPPPDDPGDPPPRDDPKDAAFLKYVRELTAETEAANHGDIADVFLGIAERIDSGDLKTSKPIEAATVRALFGPKGKEAPAWRQWWLKLWPHMVDDLRLMTPKGWAKHYRLVAKGVES